MRRRQFLQTTLGLALAHFAARPTQALDFPTTTLEGTVVGFSNAGQLLTVHSRFGTRRFLLTPETLILLNTHTASTGDIRAGDRVKVIYEHHTSIAIKVHLTREIRHRGLLVDVRNNTVEFRIQGAVVNTTRNNATRFELNGIPVINPEALVGVRGRVVMEPGSLLLLRFVGEGKRFNGRVSAVNPANRTISITAGRRTRTFELAADAEIRRNHELVTLGALQIGDRIRLGFIKERKQIIGLVAEAFAP